MKILGIAFGYDEPFWYCDPWEFFLHDKGWSFLLRRTEKRRGPWPRYTTFHWRKS